MKKILFTAAAGLFCFITSCKDSATTGTNENSQNEKNLASNRKLYKAIETGDKSVLDSLIAKDAIDHQGPSETGVKGGDSIIHGLVEMHNQVKDLKLNVVSDATNGDYIFALVHMSGTTNDASMGLPAGTKMDENGVDVVRVKDGKFIEHWGFVDANEMMKHMKDAPMNGKMDKMTDTMNTK